MAFQITIHPDCQMPDGARPCEGFLDVYDALRASERTVDRFSNALRRIAAPRGCGCAPVCQCDTAEALKIELEEIRAIAEAAMRIPSLGEAIELARGGKAPPPAKQGYA